MGARWRFRRAWTVLAVLAVTAMVGSTAPALALKHPDYIGHASDRFYDARVEVAIKSNPGGKIAYVKVKHIKVFCSGDPHLHHIDFPLLKAPFTSAQTFSGSDYSSADGRESYYAVTGAISRGNRVRGNLYYFEGSLDPQQPDCTIEFPPLRWKGKGVS